MYYFTLKMFAPTASFRLPEAHTFQQTLPLPPATALIGMAGAAMGLSFAAAMELREKTGLRCGVSGRHKGESSDLWKYQKIKSDEVISAVLTREILYEMELLVTYTMLEQKTAVDLKEAFLDPVYALTAGTSDDLVKVLWVSEVKEADPKPCHNYENTILPGDHSRNYESAIQAHDLPLNRIIRAPRVFLLPTSFEFNGESRRVKSRAQFTFIDTPVILKDPVDGITCEGKVVPLL